MDPVWRFLPDHLVLRVLEFSNEIDQRIFFKILPKKLVIDKNFEFRNEIVYDRFSKTMFDFSGMSELEHPYWVMRKGINFSQYRSAGIHVFNMGWDPYQMTMFSGQDQVGPSTCANHIVLHKKVKFK
jgi:hypothetical protein